MLRRHRSISPRVLTSAPLALLIPGLLLGCQSSDRRDPGSSDGGSTGISLTSGTEWGTAEPGPDDDGGIRLDVGNGGTAGNSGGGDCQNGGGGGEDYAFSIIWVSNTIEGTVSKIDTQTAVELARYRTGPGEPDPSRTSVNLLGDVAIANRSGSVVKIAAEASRCIDVDGDGEITTSQNAGDVLAWGEDECVLWFHQTSFDTSIAGNDGGPRAIAWDAGPNPASPCTNSPNIWVGWRDQPNPAVKIQRLDGQTGEVLGEVDVPDWQGNWGHGTYGGAADAEGAFWALGTLGTIIRVDPVSLDVERWDNPVDHVMYGIALDAAGNPWLAGWDGGLWKFDVGTEAFIDMGAPEVGSTRFRGLAIDTNGHAWLAGNNTCALARFDTQTEAWIRGDIELPGCSEPVGVSVDIEGMIWVVDRGSDRAYKVDPETYSTQTVTGLVKPYTYSDMTGAGLNLVVNPPAG